MQTHRAVPVPALMLCLSIHLLQVVLGTTVIPSCIPGESEDNCTALGTPYWPSKFDNSNDFLFFNFSQFDDMAFLEAVQWLLLLKGASKKATEYIQLTISFTVQTEDNPRVAQVSITKCGSDMNGFCLHGQCIYLVDMSEHYCRCDVGYTGVRCEHFFLTVHQPLSTEYVALTVILTLFFLVIVSGSIYYFCRWYRNRKSKESKKEYERVTSGGSALPQV